MFYCVCTGCSGPWNERARGGYHSHQRTRREICDRQMSAPTSLLSFVNVCNDPALSHWNLLTWFRADHAYIILNIVETGLTGKK